MSNPETDVHDNTTVGSQEQAARSSAQGSHAVTDDGGDGKDEAIAAPPAPAPGASPQARPEYPQGIVLALVLISLMLSMFLVALDMVSLQCLTDRWKVRRSWK